MPELSVSQSLLDVQNLSIAFDTDAGPVTVVRNLDLRVAAHETVAIVGESGSGKSVTALAITRLIDYAGGRITTGSIDFTDRTGRTRDLAAAEQEEMRQLRGLELAMVFQEPMTCLNPVLRIGDQIGEAIILHQGVGRAEARAETKRLLDRVRIPEAAAQLDRYPFQLSGGMRQRVMIAMALACRPRLLICDEPTTALDVTVQAQVLRLIQSLQRELGMALIFITHNLGVVAEIADRVMVMYAGRIVEQAPMIPLLTHPLMPYTQGLLRSVPLLPVGGKRRGKLQAIAGNVPEAARLPPGCSFAPRCPHVIAPCEAALPELDDAADGHLVRCLRWRELAA